MKLVLTAERQRRCVICDLHDNGPGSWLGNGNYLLKAAGGAPGRSLGVGVLAVPITAASELSPCGWWSVLRVLGRREGG